MNGQSVNGKTSDATMLRRVCVAVVPLAALIGMIVLGVTVFGETVPTVAGYYKALMTVFFSSTHVATGNEALDHLVATRGMSGMLSTVWLILCAVSFGGVMYAGGMLRTLADVAIACVRSVVGLVGATAFTGALMNAASGDQYISILVTADMFGGVYRAKGVESRLLSRRSFAVLFRGEFWYNSSHETVQRSKEASEMVPREEARGREDRPCADDGVSA